jgi:hypothetical protein
MTQKSEYSATFLGHQNLNRETRYWGLNTSTHTGFYYYMSGYKNFAVAGAGKIGSFIIRQLITDKAAGTVNDVIVLTRQANLVSTSEMHTLIIFHRDLKPLLILPPS